MEDDGGADYGNENDENDQLYANNSIKNKTLSPKASKEGAAAHLRKKQKKFKGITSV